MLKNWAILTLLGLIWGGAFTFTGVAVATVPPLVLAAARLLIGAGALLIIAYASGVGLPKRSESGVWAAAMACAIVANAAPFVLLAWAQQHIASGLAGVFMATMPLIVLPIAHVFAPGESLTLRRALGFLIGFLGVVTLIGWETLFELGGAGVEILAQFACLGAAFGYAAGSVVTRRAPSAHPYAFGAATLLLAAAILTPIALLNHSLGDIAWSANSALAIIYLGLAPTGLAMILLYIVIRRAGAGFLSLVNYQAPIWALLFGVIFLNESIPERAAPALGLILFGLAISQTSRRRVIANLTPPRP